MRTVALEEHFIAKGYDQEFQQSRGQEITDRLKDLGEGRIADMDANGIDVQVLGHNVQLSAGLESPESSIAFARTANDQLAEAIKAFPGRLAGFAALPLLAPEQAVGEFDRCVTELGFHGAMLNGTTGGRFLDDERFFPVLAKAAALDVPIYLHPAIPPASVREVYYEGLPPAVGFALSGPAWGWHVECGLHALRLILAGVFDKLPNLQIIIGHMGELIPFMFERIQWVLGEQTDYLERGVLEYLQQNFHVTTSGLFTEALFTLCTQTFGLDRVMFSVDYPYARNADARRFLDGLRLSPADKAKISHGNADRLLKLPS